MTKKILLTISLLSLIFLTWCWDPDPCADSDDSKHCYQDEAVAAWDASLCKKIDWKEFKQYWSNPPRDKCYMMVAAQNNDYSLCSKIKWWEMSYTKEDCIFEVISKNDDPKWCDRLKWDDRYKECNETFRSANSLVMKDQIIDDLTQQIKDDPENEELKAQLKKEMESKKKLFPFLSSEEQSNYIKENREKIMEDVDDTDVQSAIAKEYNEYKKNNPDADVITMLDKMKDIADKQKMMKQADEDANALIDTLKDQMMDIAQQWEDAITDAIKDKATDWIKENWWERLKRSLKNLEWMKEKYDTASQEYAAIQEKYNKLKDAYDKINWIYSKIDGFDTLVAQWKITAEKANVLKWAVLLQNWLTAVTEYVPVFGSTISKVTDATFEATMKFAQKRAERATALDKCIDDPLNCDTDSISWY